MTAELQNTEQWRVVRCAPGYEVSNKGHIRWAVNPDYTVPTFQGANGLNARIRAYQPGMYAGRRKMHNFSVARLTASAFICEPPSPTAVIRYLDGNKSNVTPENLAWAERPQRTWDSVSGRFLLGDWRYFPKGPEARL